ncbi:hypothetical protein JQX13_42840 [Archangium violaceum]|uniref:DUF6602 domain-containing protein n=1 Tax=Archangium violaceum TaxID=83451 RepID=UPI00193B3F99|nr:DUF6602 domain-containing protein [Archangium violaceum]QRK06740.1 hypothetical protein JQX13_42840 [Archangium violaceum]
MAEMERHLIASGRIPASTGHSIHKGTPRETFVREYLQNHLSERLAIGSGEIIDANSQPGQPRPQIDIVLYKREYPRLSFGGGIHGFLAESVVATIEVKSILDQAGFEQSAKTAHYLKSLKRNTIRSFSSGYIPPDILSFIVAYDGPASISTVHGWVGPTYRRHGIPDTALPTDPIARVSTASTALDGVIVLGKGFMYYDNVPFGFIRDDKRTQHPDAKWVFADTATDNLLLLFLFLTTAARGVALVLSTAQA